MHRREQKVLSHHTPLYPILKRQASCSDKGIPDCFSCSLRCIIDKEEEAFSTLFVGSGSTALTCVERDCESAFNTPTLSRVA